MSPLLLVLILSAVAFFAVTVVGALAQAPPLEVLAVATAYACAVFAATGALALAAWALVSLIGVFA